MISASVAGANQATLGPAVAELSRHVDLIHIDLEDGVFSPCLTLGPAAVRDLRPFSSLPFEAHLMLARPEEFIRQVAEAGADAIVVNVEACPYPLRVVRLIRSLGKEAGLAYNWGTSLASLAYLGGELDTVLLLVSEPDFAGQGQLALAPERVAEAARILAGVSADSGRQLRIIVDGGVNPQNAVALRDRGAGEFVVGRYLWQGRSVAEQSSKLRAALEG